MALGIGSEAVKAGIGVAGAIAGQGMGLLFGKAQDRRQVEQQKKLQELQIKGNKEMLDYNQDKQLDMWNKTNYGAQVEHLKDAGLNPALIYGMSGGGATTVGSGGGAGVSGSQASDGASRQQAATAQGMAMMQASLMGAQKENIEAQTAKTKAEAEKISGVDTQQAKAQTGLLDVTTRIKEIEANIAGKTQEAAIQTIEEGAAKMLAEAVQAQQQQVINEETLKDKIQQIKAESIGAMIENEAKRSGINVNSARIREIAENIEQRWRGLDVDVENNKRMTEAMLWGAGIHAAGNLVGGITNIMGKAVPNVTKQIK